MWKTRRASKLTYIADQFNKAKLGGRQYPCAKYTYNSLGTLKSYKPSKLEIKMAETYICIEDACMTINQLKSSIIPLIYQADSVIDP